MLAEARVDLIFELVGSELMDLEGLYLLSSKEPYQLINLS